MAKKEFKTESKKLLDMMINSVYTHKEIFLRELISNASDAIDKLYFRSLTDDSITLTRDDYEIRLSVNADERILQVSDNGCGMTLEELEDNLGTIARSGSFDFKNDPDQKTPEAIDIIGQFGVGFYSAFMVSDEITVDTRPYGSDKAYRWQSQGVDGYTVGEGNREGNGTTITLHLKEDADEENYGEFLHEWKLRTLVKKYSDYIRYPIRMQVEKSRRKPEPESEPKSEPKSESESADLDNSEDVQQELDESLAEFDSELENEPESEPDLESESAPKEPEYETYYEDETLNSMIPIWKKSPSEVTEEEYANFYSDKFYDYEKPLKVIRQKSEGTSEFEALLFVPAHAPFDYYTKDYERGLQLYSSGVLIMEKCKDLIPDHFSFIRGLVDSADLSLNISREMLQHNRQLKIISRALEKKIGNELSKMVENDRENYEKFFSAFGTQLKYGIYSEYGSHKDLLQDLLLFRSSFGDKPVTLKEYVSRMKEDQKQIYYAPGDSVEQIALLPQVEAVLGHEYEVLYLTEEVDEFALQMMRNYAEKDFCNVCKDTLDLGTEEEKETLKQENEASADLFAFMKESIGDAVHAVRFTSSLKNHPACLSNEGELSVNMEKTLNRMPGSNERQVKADLVLEINLNHPIAARLRELYADNSEDNNNNRDKLARYSKILYANARLISGLHIDNASEIGDMVADLMI